MKEQERGRDELIETLDGFCCFMKEEQYILKIIKNERIYCNNDAYDGISNGLGTVAYDGSL